MDLELEDATGVVVIGLLLIALVLTVASVTPYRTSHSRVFSGILMESRSVAGIETIEGFDVLAAGESAVGYLAAGNFSAGILSTGIFSVGLFAAGIFSVGVFSIGIFSIGIFSFGIYAAGLYAVQRHMKTAAQQTDE